MEVIRIGAIDFALHVLEDMTANLLTEIVLAIITTYVIGKVKPQKR